MPDTSPTDGHRFTAIIARPDPAIREQAAEILEANGWAMNEFVEASLTLLTKNPTAMLARLAKFRVVRKRGRPRGSGKPK